MTNPERVATIIHNEEVKALALFDEMEKKAPTEVKKRGVSPDTFGFLYATRGWHPEILCPLIVDEGYYGQHKEEIDDAIERHSTVTKRLKDKDPSVTATN